MNTSSPKTTLNTILLTAIATTLAASVIIGISSTASAGETQTADDTPVFTVEQSGKRVVNQGVIAYRKGDFSKAAAFNRDALHQGLKPSHLTVLYSNQCAALGSQNRYAEALEACDKALKLAPAIDNPV